MIHFLQSKMWDTFQQAMGRQTIYRHGANWSYRGVIERGTGNTRLYLPYGPSFNSAKSFQSAVDDLVTQAKTHKVDFVRVEPTDVSSVSELKARGFRPVSYQQLNPTHTLILDLEQSEPDIYAGMSSTTRNIVRNYHKKGIVIRKSYNPDDITILTRLLAGVAAKNHIRTHSDQYFKAQATALFPIKAAALLIAYLEETNTPIAATLVYDSDTTRYYAHAAADREYQKLQAATALLGFAIFDAKAQGLTSFDFYGITDSDDPKHPWAGFTRFKKSFGGVPIEYAGPWDLPIRQVRYMVYRMYQALYRRIRTLLS